MSIARRALGPLARGRTYTRWVHLVLGGVLFVPYCLAVLVVVTLVTRWGPGTWSAGVLVVVSVATVVLVGATGLLPGVRAQQVQVGRALLGGPMEQVPDPGGGRAGPRERVRSGAALALHFGVGLVVAVATMVVLTDAATLALVAVTGAPADAVAVLTALPVALPQVSGVAARVLGPVAGLVLLVVFVLVVAAVGAGAARVGPLLLGPSVSERLAQVRRRADELTERNRLAAELHDSIGHALSVVALQAGTAARVLEQDPAFARAALEAIAEQARTATGELDHVLGLLRQERSGRAPEPSLTDVEHLVRAARGGGAEVECVVQGPVGDVAPVLSRELYRICQEGLTNALRHGAPGGPVRLWVRVDGSGARVEVANPVGAGAGARRGGHGLEGAAERVRLLGGELEYGARDGWWTLSVRIDGAKG
ncbi:two-component sensor histidine kinase [Nocardiopsis sp. HNM0947]|uniref:histidine kinase n=1 Tax=Nocardiopsis coralli TaxID=2772213 RepID=A0ABR9P6U5_9ACTN|nr:histidine kinase [Nocardiopsis coralli]MBE2999556.1 two-component sensor histidine kinase [Nocardiopsis coralli]